MRVLVLTNWYPPHHFGGYEASCHDVMTRLAARGHDVSVLCSDERSAGVAAAVEEPWVRRELRLYVAGGDQLLSPAPMDRWRIERHNQRALRRALDEVRPDVVSVWHMGGLSLGLLTTLIEQDVPVVYAVCDDWLLYGPRLDAWTRLFERSALARWVGLALRPVVRVPTVLADLGSSGAFCFVSEQVRQRAESVSPWSFPVSTVVYSGIDRSAFPGRAPDMDRPWRWRLLYAGRFDPRKGIATLLRALALLPSAAALELLGRGGTSERARLEQLAADLGLADRVRFGSADRSELAERYRLADVVVFPSEWDEPFGLVPVEAMACATPVVATGTGGSAEFLADGANCVLFAPGDPNALAAAVRRLHDDPELRRGIVEGGMRTADELDADRLADTFEAWHEAAARRFADGQPDDRPPPVAAGHSGAADPLGRHQARTAAVVAGGRSADIKRLYVDLGADLQSAHQADLDTVPVLSAPETHPVVVGVLEAVEGLVLDAGCGPHPAVAISLGASPRRRVVALDIGLGTVHLARAVARHRGTELIGVVGDVEHLPFRQAAFDGLACDDTVEHLPDDAAGVAELARVLRPGGTAALATPNRHSAEVLRARLRDRARARARPAAAYYVASSHLREYTWREFEQLVGASFRPRRRLPVGWRHRGWKSRVATRLLELPGARRLSQMIVLEAEPR